MPEASSSAHRGRLLRVVAACAVLLALAGYLYVHFTTGGTEPPRCTVRGTGPDGGSYELQPEQAMNAATIEAVGSARGLPERAITIALATAMQESQLRNIDYGDRDSLGLFQQRPSQGWGKEKQILDPVYSAGRFYDHLVKVPGYSRLPLTVAAQKVQRSGYPQAYAKHEPDALLLTAALTGRQAAAFSCTRASGGGAVGDPARVREKLVKEFGRGVLPRAEAGTGGQQAAGGRDKGASGPTVAVPVPAAAAGTGGSVRRGWELAHWAVAHSFELGIAQVSYGDRMWRSADSGKGWQQVDGKVAAEKARAASQVLITTAQ